MDKIRKVGPDGAAASVDCVALRTHRLLAEEFAVTAGPTAARQLRRADGNESILRLAARVGPRQQQAAERKRPRPIILVRRPFDRERRGAALLREPNFDRHKLLRQSPAP